MAVTENELVPRFFFVFDLVLKSDQGPFVFATWKGSVIEGYINVRLCVIDLYRSSESSRCLLGTAILCILLCLLGLTTEDWLGSSYKSGCTPPVYITKYMFLYIHISRWPIEIYNTVYYQDCILHTIHTSLYIIHLHILYVAPYIEYNHVSPMSRIYRISMCIE